MIKHKVIAKYLETMMMLLRINRLICCSKGISNNPLDLREENISHKINLELRLCLVEIALVFFEWYLIACFILSIIISLLLYCIICKMDQFISYLLQIVLSRACSYITIFIKISFLMTIYWCQHAIASNIKFSVFKQCWILHILLNNKSSVILIRKVAEYILYFLELLTDCNTVSSISIFPRLYNPNISLFVLFIFPICHCIILRISG